MSKKGLLVLGVIFLVHAKPFASSNSANDFDSVNDTSRASAHLRDAENSATIGRSDDGQTDLRLREPPTKMQKRSPFGGIDGSVPRIRRRRWANGTFVESLEDGIYYVAEPPISMLWKVITTPLLVTGNAIIAPVTSFADRVNAAVDWLAEVLLALTWRLTKNVMLPKADESLMKLARGNVLPEYLNQLVTSMHFVYELLKFFGYWKPA